MGLFLKSSDVYIIVYLIAVNIFGFTIMGIDKWKARKSARRIAEKTLFLAAYLGGAAGVLSGMKVFHHKTLHKKFKYGIPAVLMLNIALIIYILYMV